MTRTIEQVSGHELKVGDILVNQGFDWRIVAVRFQDDPYRNGGAGRYCVDAVYGGDDPNEQAWLGGYGSHMMLGLRHDLKWWRVVA